MSELLIIDDEKELADTVADYFAMFGLSAQACYDEKAVDCLTTDIKVVLLDINLVRYC